jgi:hypothetical protein
MGWWSTDIMGGDTPLDFESELYHHAGVKQFDEDCNSPDLTAEDIARALPAYLSEVAEKYEIAEDRPVALQVLAYFMMKTGCPISEELKARFHQAADDDEWASEDEERFRVMQEFKAALDSHQPGQSLTLPTKGLFQTIFEGMMKEGEV